MPGALLAQTPAPAAPQRILQEQAYKQRVIQWWQTRAPTYDSRASFHPKLAKELVRRAQLVPGHRALDIASGTGKHLWESMHTVLPFSQCEHAGFVALDAARRVGPSGKVVAQDISGSMLAEVRSIHLSHEGTAMSCFPSCRLRSSPCQALPT